MNQNTQSADAEIQRETALGKNDINTLKQSGEHKDGKRKELLGFR